jgi:hypothetical protein
LSFAQIAWLCKKKATSSKVGNASGIMTGETDDIYYKFPEEPGNYYVSLLARGPTEDPMIASKVSNGLSTLFNGIEDIAVGGDVDQEMLQVVDNHHQELNIADSKEMMVAIAYGMTFELAQFSLFHVSLHIDNAKSDTNKEGLPFVSGTSKDSYGDMFFALRAFLPSEQIWAYKWLQLQTVFPVLIGNRKGCIEQT